MNLQPIEKRVSRGFDGTLQVHSIFETIQGEGPFCGTPCVFVRLAGCNLQCPACDTDYTSRRLPLTPMQIWGEVAALRPGGLVVITGGEPFRQDLEGLLKLLVAEGYYVQIETNGTLQPCLASYSVHVNLAYRQGVYVVCSPKTGKLAPGIFDVSCALKYVVEHDSIRPEDGLPLEALQHSANPYPARPVERWAPRPIYVQPMDSHDPIQNKANYDAAVESCMRFGYILQLQIHKIIGVE